MSREEAINIMKVIVHMLEEKYDTDRIEEAVDMAIKALETASCIKEKCAYCPHCEHCDVDDETLEIKALEQEPCDDCVRRQEVLDAIAANCIWENEYNLTSSRIKKAVEDLPPVTPELETVTEFADRCHECGAKYGKLLKQEPCEDAISRQAVLDEMKIRRDNGDMITAGFIKGLPSVTPQPKSGRWIEHFDESGKWYECDQCHTDWGGPVNYCPNCGCAMGVDKR